MVNILAKADFYALRKFLDIYFKGVDNDFAKFENFFPMNSYFFTFPHKSGKISEFSMSRANNIFNFYEIINFIFDGDKIWADFVKAKNAKDLVKAKSLISILDETFHTDSIFNFDELKDKIYKTKDIFQDN
jgi:hypothetical protein